MSDFNYQDFRQPWETGPHWELKKEFIEQYKNNFPEERLLCLAQAYSNIQLLNCSYPTPVMLQIHELSKPLKECKKYHGNKNTESSGQSAPEMKKGKRKLPEISSNLPKLLKFSSRQEEALKSVDSSNYLDLKNSPSMSSCSIKDVDFDLIQDLAETISKQKNIDTSLNIIKNASKTLGVEDSVVFRAFSEGYRVNQSSTYVCHFFVGDSLVSIGRDSSREKAKINAAVNGIEYFKKLPNRSISKLNVHKNFQNVESKSNAVSSSEIIGSELSSVLNVPLKHLTADTKSCSSVENAKLNSENKCMKSKPSIYSQIANSIGIDIMRNFIQEIRNGLVKNKSAVEAIQCAVQVLKIQDVITYNIILDPESELHSPKYVCNLLVNDIIISSVKERSKKKAKLEAAKSAIDTLLNFSNATDITVPIEKNEPDSKNLLKCPPLNNSLLNTSFEKQFVLFDNSENQVESQRTLTTLLHDSARFSQKSISYNFEDTASYPSKVDVILDGCVISSGTACNKKEAKGVAISSAVKTLKKLVYTIKVRKEDVDGFIVTRNQILNSDTYLNSLSEDNIGCKMLKNMGWTGGGFGSSGIVDPVIPQANQFGHGLGYNKTIWPIKDFQKKIDALLQDFSASDTYEDLVFSSEFSKEEREAIHKIAPKYHLHTVSRGVGDARYLRVKRKLKMTELLERLVKAGGSFSKFFLYDASNEQ